jgi:hypothetical protein
MSEGNLWENHLGSVSIRELLSGIISLRHQSLIVKLPLLIKRQSISLQSSVYLLDRNISFKLVCDPPGCGPPPITYTLS